MSYFLLVLVNLLIFSGDGFIQNPFVIHMVLDILLRLKPYFIFLVNLGSQLFNDLLHLFKFRFEFKQLLILHIHILRIILFHIVNFCLIFVFKSVLHDKNGIHTCSFRPCHIKLRLKFTTLPAATV